MNYNRRKQNPKIRIPIGKPTRIIPPEDIYDRHKEKEKFREELEKLAKEQEDEGLSK